MSILDNNPKKSLGKILVTGGAGFIGSHLVDSLLVQGYEVIVLDNLSVGRLSNLEQHTNNPNFAFYEIDISCSEAIEKYFHGVECCFHLAARADIVPSIQMPMIYHQANVDGTISVLEACRKHGVGRFVYAASSSCYGLAETVPTPETAPIQPQYPYALTKYLGEQIAMHWGQVYGLSVVSCRFFNVFGPRARTSGTYGAVFGVFLAQRSQSLPLTIVGEGTQTRDFTYVLDVVDALCTVAKSSVRQEIFNVGSGGTYSVNYLAKLIGGQTVSIPKRPGEPDCTFADISKIQNRVGWKPKTSFEQGVKILLREIDRFSDAPLWTPATIQEATRDWFKYLSPSH